jgi:hypothetical protein
LQARVTDTGLRAAPARVLQEATADDGLPALAVGTGAVFDDRRDCTPTPLAEAGRPVTDWWVLRDGLAGPRWHG